MRSRLITWLRRFRHRRGYGIHSPFAFTFVTDVVYNRGTYYAYASLRRHYAAHRREWHGLRLKDCLLLFRLANYQHPSVVRLVGFEPSHPVREFLKAASVNCCVGSTASQPDLVLADEAWASEAPALIGTLAEGAMLILTQVGGANRAAWQQLLAHPHAQIAFDLYDFGIVMNLPQLQRAHYVVNYF